MRSHELESWVLEIIDRVEKRQPVEDSRVELKTDWIDPTKAARRIAGHANAARGETILWIIGVDENNGVIGVDHKEFSDWFAQISKHFDGLAPSFQEINIPYNGKTVVAILFDTERVPFVINNPDGGMIGKEVPWREGTRIRTAKRIDLIKILSPIQRIPKIEILEAKLILAKNRRISTENYLDWSFHVQMYITPSTRELIVFPYHKITASIELLNSRNQIDLLFRSFRPLYKSVSRGTPTHLRILDSEIDSVTLDHTKTELLISGPGSANFSAGITENYKEINIEQKILMKVYLYLATYDYPVEIQKTLEPVQLLDNQIGQWKLKD